MNARIVSALLGAAFLVSLSGNGHAAEGALTSASRLSPAARTALVAGIQKARQQHPELFAALSRLRADMNAMEAKKRGRFAPVVPRLRALGPEALFPLIDAVAFTGGEHPDIAGSAWSTYRAGLLEALGMLRDPRALPVLSLVFASNEDDPLVIKSAAMAIGRLGSDEAVDLLVLAAGASGAKQRAAVLGLGESRRVKAAEALASLGDGASDELLSATVSALGQVGNAWAWKTPAVAQSGEEEGTRRIAAAALVRAFVAHPGETRKAAEKALLLVDAKETPALIESAKSGASPESSAALDALAVHMAKNPTR
jgi:HEAT repeat protein